MDALLRLALPSGKAADGPGEEMAERMAFDVTRPRGAVANPAQPSHDSPDAWHNAHEPPES
jgi:hypothetical protein